MKIIKADEVQLPETQEPGIDQNRIDEAKVKFDTLREALQVKKYAVSLDAGQTDYLFNNFYQNVSWKGYESYAIAETFERLYSLVSNQQDFRILSGETETEIIEAIFHFLKNHIGTGIGSARLFKQICDQFALPMKEINEDRQELRDLSLELVAAEQGISVEKLMQDAQAAQAN